MASDVSICNLALSHLGDEATVTSIDPPEGSAQAEHCQRFYPIARGKILETHPWGFATRRIPLVELANVEPPESWMFAYQRPNKCVRSLAVLAPGCTSDDAGSEFIEETVADDVQVIYTNVEEATLRYIVLVEDTARYTTLFVDAFARLLASYLAGPVIKGTEGMKVAGAQLLLYQGQDGKGGALALAKAADANSRRKNTYDTFVPASLQARR